MTSPVAELETHRLELQARLDAGKEKSARNKMGQFATPPGLALDLLGYAKTQLGKGYLCRNRRPWYVQENRPPAPFVCTYLGRSDAKSGHPFRFILNDSQATAANVYLMLYPREPLKQVLEERADIKRKLWRCLNETCPQALLDEGRVYGGGLHKLEPKELGNVSARAIAELLSAELPNSGQAGVQGKLFPGLVA